MKFNLLSEYLVCFRAPNTWKLANVSLRLSEGGKKPDGVDKATGAHYLVVYAGPRCAIDGCQRRISSRQMGLNSAFHAKDE